MDRDELQMARDQVETALACVGGIENTFDDIATRLLNAVSAPGRTAASMAACIHLVLERIYGAEATLVANARAELENAFQGLALLAADPEVEIIEDENAAPPENAGVGPVLAPLIIPALEPAVEAAFDAVVFDPADAEAAIVLLGDEHADMMLFAFVAESQ